jgi:hypothetical protein
MQAEAFIFRLRVQGTTGDYIPYSFNKLAWDI